MAKWQDEWPPNETISQSFYLKEDFLIESTVPISETAAVSFSYDPEAPSPTIGGKTLNLALDQGPYDQRQEVESRSDALVFSTDVLTEDLIMKGVAKVELFVSSDQLDTDVTLRLTEVYPDGRSMLLGETIQRLRFPAGYRETDEAFLNPEEVYPVTLKFDPLANTFKTGHRLRLIVSSSNYPRYNRNMNTGGEMYPNGNIDTLVNPLVANNTIFVNNSYPSRLEIPLADPISSVSKNTLDQTRIIVFPNPANDYLLVDHLPSNGQIQLFDSNGQLQFKQPFQETTLRISLSDLVKGVYWMEIMDAQGAAEIKKVIIH